MRKLLAIALIIAFSSSLFAALDVRTVWELNPSATAGNVNGGGFDPFASVANMIADLECTSGTTSAPSCGSVTYPFVAGDATHWLFISSGTGFTANQFCQINSISSGRAVLTAGAGTCNVIPNGAASTTNWTTNSAAGVGAASPSVGVFAIDRSRSTANVQSSTTATNTVGVITLGSLTYDKSWIGNVIQLVAGTSVTQGWYEITQSVLSTSFTLDRDPGGTTNVSMNLGGAISLGSATANRTDDAFFELGSSTTNVGASRFWVKSGTYPTLTTVSIASVCAVREPCRISGYNSVRGDDPTGTNRPTFPLTTNTFSGGSAWEIRNIFLIGNPAGTVVTLGTNGKFINSKCVQYATSVRSCSNTASQGTVILNSELISYRGTAVTVSQVSGTVLASYLHDSDIGLIDTGTSAVTFHSGNLIEGNVTAAISMTGAKTGLTTITNNTLFGSANTTGTGLLVTTGTSQIVFTNNIVSGFVAGVNGPDSQTSMFDNYNDYSNNDTDVTAGWQKGANDITTAPAFTSAAQLVNSGTVSSSANVLTDTTAVFTNVLDDVDCIYIISGSGTGFGVGIYPIHSHTTTTLTLATPVTAVAMNITSSGAGTSIVYQFTTGHNFLPTATQANLAGFPGAMQGALTTGFQTIGAVQKSSASAGGCVGCD